VAGRLAPILGSAAVVLFGMTAWQRGVSTPMAEPLSAQVVVPAIAQIVLYGGDRFLAASVESVRAAASGHGLDGQAGGYRLRAHRVVSQLNPCHEDNYWIGNAALSFGGASTMGSELLGRASQCRFWDELPPFLYGFNQKFFNLKPELARKAIELAADRSPKNAPGYRQIALMMTVNSIEDARVALAMLAEERDRVKDPHLRRMLERRVERMRGLVILRDARKVYEERTGKRLVDPLELVQTRVLESYPVDPMRLGYELRDGEFYLRSLKVDGLN
jgi:hypothetical protein